MNCTFPAGWNNCPRSLSGFSRNRSNTIESVVGIYCFDSQTTSEISVEDCTDHFTNELSCGSFFIPNQGTVYLFVNNQFLVIEFITELDKNCCAYFPTCEFNSNEFCYNKM